MKNFGKLFWLLPVIVIVFAIAGCKGKDTFEDTGAGPSGAPPPAADADADGDGVLDTTDNCPNISNSDQVDSNENGVGDACEGEAPQTVMIEVTSVKILKQDNAEIDLLLPASPIPLRPQYIEVTYSAAVDCEVIKSNVSLMLNDAQVPDVTLSCPEETKLRIAPAKNLVPRSNYKIHFAAWETDKSFAERDVQFRTMTSGDVNGDGFPDIAVGAPLTTTNFGTIYIYDGKKLKDGESALMGSFESTETAQFGTSITLAGDINADGFADIVAGGPALNFSKGGIVVFNGFKLATEGAFGVLFGKTSSDDSAVLGCSVAAADIDGDGYSDVVAGAWGYNHRQGSAYVFSGKTGAQIGPIMKPPIAGTNDFGKSVAASDVTGDGTPDIFVGAPYYNLEKGRVYIYDGKALTTATGTVAPIYKEIKEPIYGKTSFGISLGTGRDINQDGVNDLIVGAPQKSTFAGALYVYSGADIKNPSISPVTTPLLKFEQPSTSAGLEFGKAVAFISDLTGDGSPEIAVGAPGMSGGGGAVIVYDKTLTPLGFIVDASLSGASKLGSSLAATDDFNGDGFSDIVIGAPFASSAAGYIGVYTGIGSMMLPIVKINSPSASSQFGASVNGGQ